MIWDRREGPAAAAGTNSLAVMICFSFVFVFSSSYVIDYLFPFLFLMLNLLSSQSPKKILSKLHVDWWNFFFCWRTLRNCNCCFETLFENSFFYSFVSSLSSSSFFNITTACVYVLWLRVWVWNENKNKMCYVSHWHVSRCERGNNQQTTELASVHAHTIDVDG